MFNPDFRECAQRKRFERFADWVKRQPTFGAYNGLHSRDEIVAIMMVVYEFARHREHTSVLEIGHFFGCSTAAIYRALMESGRDWHFTTVDFHQADPHVPVPAPVEAFEDNRYALFNDARLVPVYGRSEDYSPDEALVFYDGNHQQEQEAFTRKVHESACEVFMFDDADFEHPAKCIEFLRENGWVEIGPPRTRYKDSTQNSTKENARTMSLAVLSREVARG